MFNIQKASEKLTAKMVRELQLDEKQQAIINYGLFAILHTGVAFVCTIILGGLLGVLVPSLIITLAGISLRKYSGGAHANTPERCTLIGLIVAIGGAYLLSRISWDITSVMVVGVFSFFIAFYLVYQLAPVDSKQKPIKSDEKKKLLRKKSIYVLIVDLIIVSLCCILYYTTYHVKYLLYMTCIYVGILWQVFSLTSVGQRIISK